MSDYIVIPKTQTLPARKAYMQLMAMCSDLKVKPEALEHAIKQVEDQAFDYKSTKDNVLARTAAELESVVKYYRWVFSNISHIRSITQEA